MGTIGIIGIIHITSTLILFYLLKKAVEIPQTFLPNESDMNIPPGLHEEKKHQMDTEPCGHTQDTSDDLEGPGNNLTR
jgi:hypothetical protein